ncbi:glycosyltransferase family 4 protein [Salinimicrobium terrae]|uniref:glycosyltransferase family 4 protein n=1 Tax=Salinimicrobium terrae TaxID=470866 RepID=UPI0003FCFA9D|nr:glycosyltransferase family 4 protein [Salinimicrobium terrae]
MKLLYVQDSLGTGGAERSNAELWYYLRKEGVQIKIVVLSHRKEGIEQEILKEGFDVNFLEPGNLISHSKQISQVIKNYKPDIVHSSLYNASMRVRMAKLFTSFYHVESLVNCLYDEVRFKDPKVNSFSLKVYRKIDKYTQKGTDKFIAVTNEVKKHYEKQLNIPASKIDFIHRGRKDNPYRHEKQEVGQQLRRELGFAQDDLIFVHVGRQEYQKAHIDILKAIKEQDEKLQQLHVKFIFCGRNGNSTDVIEDFLNKENIKTEMRFLGHRTDIYRILVASDVFVLPSLYEGIGGVSIEAQAAELPVICSDIAVFKEVMKGNPYIEFFEKSNFDDLGQKLVKLAGSPALREKMGKEGRKNYINNFQLDSINRQVLDYYKKLVEEMV